MDSTSSSTTLVPNHCEVCGTVCDNPRNLYGVELCAKCFLDYQCRIASGGYMPPPIPDSGVEITYGPPANTWSEPVTPMSPSILGVTIDG